MIHFYISSHYPKVFKQPTRKQLAVCHIALSLNEHFLYSFYFFIFFGFVFVSLAILY